MKSQAIKIALTIATTAFVSVNTHAAESDNKISTKNRSKVRVRTTQKNQKVGARLMPRAGKTTEGRVGIRASERVGGRVMDKTNLKSKLNADKIKANTQKTKQLDNNAIKKLDLQK